MLYWQVSNNNRDGNCNFIKNTSTSTSSFTKKIVTSDGKCNNNPKIEKNVKTNFLAYPIILKNNLSFSRKEIQIHLEKNNIQTRPIFSGNTLRHPAFSSLINTKNKLSSFKKSDYIMKYGLLIGCHQGLSLKDILYIQNVIINFINKNVK